MSEIFNINIICCCAAQGAKIKTNLGEINNNINILGKSVESGGGWESSVVNWCYIATLLGLRDPPLFGLQHLAVRRPARRRGPRPGGRHPGHLLPQTRRTQEASECGHQQPQVSLLRPGEDISNSRCSPVEVSSTRAPPPPTTTRRWR